ncbi:type II toxin-antitoxin system HigB family toxin [Halotia branconii]|uniref:Type II toxin-antitoxin system HigB family toxin n=1 Tax=Halotia branconii CENA392 TaxID=1539056 RepID=A0AAJ6P825_9CYAN|nr:type II toxin-antitoxin system HigB family toxin [Halotia branconii]WGV24192.1 type II toxin-antitoxin system HigB family toxin [Halotia branconii CENA392]
MHVISRRILREFCKAHADACDALYDWYRVTTKAEWKNLVEVQAIYPKAEAVGNFTVFNIKGNKYRLIVSHCVAVSPALREGFPPQVTGEPGGGFPPL